MDKKKVNNSDIHVTNENGWNVAHAKIGVKQWDSAWQDLWDRSHTTTFTSLSEDQQKAINEQTKRS